MIPLAQYLTHVGDDDFVPLGPGPVRRMASPADRPTPRAERLAPEPRPVVARLRPPVEAPARPVAAPKPAAPLVRAVTEPRVPLRDLESERAAWAAERQRLEDQIAEAAEAAAAARAQALEEGQAIGRRALEAEAEARVGALGAELAAGHEAALAEARSRWSAEQGDRLADLMILQIAIFEDTLKAAVTDIVRPLATDARKRQSIDELAAAVKTIAFDGAAFKIAASGPGDLIAALSAKLGDHARLLTFTVDDARPDIRIDADSTVIETRLASWRQSLEEALS